MAILVPDLAWKLIRRNIERAKHTLIVGPRGCGKTSLAMEVAALLKRPLEVFHFGGIFDAEAAVMGSMALRNGETRFVRSRFIEAVMTPSCVVILDELNRAPVRVHTALLSLMDFQCRLVLDLEEPERRIIERASGVVFIATANQGAEYVGTEPLDAALLDRLQFLRLYYSPEEEVLLRSHGVKAREARELVRLARAIREQHARGALPATISTRGLLAVADLLADGFGSDDAFEAVVGVFDDPALSSLRTTLHATS